MAVEFYCKGGPEVGETTMSEREARGHTSVYGTALSSTYCSKSVHFHSDF